MRTRLFGMSVCADLSLGPRFLGRLPPNHGGRCVEGDAGGLRVMRSGVGEQRTSFVGKRQKRGLHRGMTVKNRLQSHAPRGFQSHTLLRPR